MEVTEATGHASQPTAGICPFVVDGDDGGNGTRFTTEERRNGEKRNPTRCGRRTGFRAVGGRPLGHARLSSMEMTEATGHASQRRSEETESSAIGRATAVAPDFARLV